MVSAETVSRLKAVAESAPADLDALTRYCLAAGFDEAVQYLRARIQGPAAEIVRLSELTLMAFLCEVHGHEVHGLPQFLIRDISALEFRFARAELEQVVGFAFPPSSLQAAIIVSDALLSLGRIDEAQRICSAIEGYQINLDRDFHNQLDLIDPLEGLPKLLTVKPLPVGVKQVIFASGDGVYFEKYGATLLAAGRAHGHQVVLHLMDSDAPPPSDACAVFTERTGQGSKSARFYYHAIRFVRLWQLCIANPSLRVVAVDMDSQLTQSLDPLFHSIEDVPLALYFLEGRLEARNKVAAGIVGIGSSESSRQFLHRVAAYISSYNRVGRLSWGLDQAALYCVLTRSLPFPCVNIAAMIESFPSQRNV
jgi:hypothetical protein